MRIISLVAAIVAIPFALFARTALAADGQLQLSVVDQQTREPLACRLHLQNASGKPVKIPSDSKTGVVAWGDHVAFNGKLLLKLPVGNYTFFMERGLEYLDMTGHFRIEHFADDSKEIELHRFCNLAKEGWWAGDLNVQRYDKDLPLLMQAEDLHFVQALRPTSGKSDAARSKPAMNPLLDLADDRFAQLMGMDEALPGGALGLCNLRAALKNEPDGLAARPTGAPEAWIDGRATTSWDFPIWAALGRLDSVEVLNSQFGREAMLPPLAGERPYDKTRYVPPLGIGRWSQQVYFQLLNCGLRLPPSAGSGSGATPNPPGYPRMYVHCGAKLTADAWWAGLKAGKVFVTDGPLLRATVEDQPPGYVFQMPAGESHEFEIALTLSTRDRIRYLEIIKDGAVLHEVRLDDWQKANGKLPKVPFDRSGWFLIRAVCDTPKTYRMAMTAPYYVQVGDAPRISRRSAQFLLDWVNDRIAEQKDGRPVLAGATLADAERARDFWQSSVKKANAD